MIGRKHCPSTTSLFSSRWNYSKHLMNNKLLLQPPNSRKWLFLSDPGRFEEVQRSHSQPSDTGTTNLGRLKRVPDSNRRNDNLESKPNPRRLNSRQITCPYLYTDPNGLDVGYTSLEANAFMCQVTYALLQFLRTWIDYFHPMNPPAPQLSPSILLTVSATWATPFFPIFYKSRV